MNLIGGIKSRSGGTDVGELAGLVIDWISGKTGVFESGDRGSEPCLEIQQSGRGLDGYRLDTLGLRCL